MCGEDGADSEVCLDGCSGYEAFIEEDEFAYRYYTVRSSVARRRFDTYIVVKLSTCNAAFRDKPSSPRQTEETSAVSQSRAAFARLPA